MEPPFVPPTDPGGGGQLELFEGPPGSLSVDQFGLVGPVDRLGEGIVEAVTLDPTEATACSSASRSV